MTDLSAPSPPSSPRGRVALVLSGGGARGAYEAGVLAGFREVLGAGATSRATFDLFSGASVGAINAAFLAAHADRTDGGIPALVAIWRSLELGTHLRPRLPITFGSRRKLGGDVADTTRWGRAFLDPRPFEKMIGAQIPWTRLHDNVAAGLVQALLVSALDIGNGKTNTFVELAPGARSVPLPARDPRRITRVETVTADHILASAALPMLFPARRIGSSYFCDGGLRFNTPIAPAIRAGADKLVVIALRAANAPAHDTAKMAYPNVAFLIGKILDALLQDPIDYDLHVLERVNRILGVMAKEVPASARDRIARAVATERGLPFRRLPTLVFRPSENIGVLALDHLRRHGTGNASFAAKFLLDKAASLGADVEADLLSFILFDGAFTSMLIALGRRDVQHRAAEVEAFFRAEVGAEPATSAVPPARTA